MFGNYLKVALRHILRYKGHSFIKIFGLAVGFASCLLIYLFVADEFSFDDFHEKGDRLFRFVQIQYSRESGRETGLQEFIPMPVGPALAASIPEVARQTRFVNGQGVVHRGDRVFNETLTMVDSSFLEMFTFPLVLGDPRSALADGHRLVLTRSRAAKYFGDENPLGQTLSITYGRESRDYTVSGVAGDVPSNSSLRFDILIQIANLAVESDSPGVIDDWSRWFCPLFVELRPGVGRGAIDGKLDRFCRDHYGAAIRKQVEEGYPPFTFGLQSIAAMHLDTRVAGTAGPATSYLLSTIALAVLLIACVNFMNLSIGSSSTRSVEVGVRKVFGASRRQLVRQFGSETLVIGFLAVGLGCLFAELLLPEFNSLSGKRLTMAALFHGVHWLALPSLAAFAALLGGGYPALVMSSFRPVDIMKGKLRIGGKTGLTRALVVFQFALSVTLGLAAVILGRQLMFMTGKDPGYARRGLVVVMTQETDPLESETVYRRFRNEVSSSSMVRGVTASNREFGMFLPRSRLELAGREFHYCFDRVDPDFLATMGIGLAEGRDFSANAGADRDALIVNRRFLEELGPDFRLGQYLGDASRGFPYDRRIVGVIEDCHFASLRSEVEPLALYVGEGASSRRNTFSRIIVRVEAERLAEALPFLDASWKRVRPEKPFLSYVQDEALRSLYAPERRWSAIVRYASALSLLLASLGILGLTSITLRRRVKEIGIRKVLGAGPGRIVVMAGREFVLLVSVANLLAWPVVYLVMRRVLESYPYRIGIGPQYFVLAWAASILVAGLTIVYLSAKAALKNPVDSLRYE